MTTTDALAADYGLLTREVGLVDRSERGKLALTGPERKPFLHGQVTNDVEGLVPGTGCYAAFLTTKGKMQGDLRILDTGDELWLDTERSTLQGLFTMIHRYKVGARVELHKRTLQQGLLSLIGPAARDVAPIDGPEHANRLADGILYVATDTGVDLVCDAARTEELKRSLGVPEVSEAAAEIVRVEHGRPRFGLDMGETTIPQEAGLNDRAVSFTKGCYVGQETVARLHYRGKPNRHLRGLRFGAPVAAGTELRLGEKPVGTVATSVVSPAFGPIALALVRREAQAGDVLDAGGISATVVEPPFAT